MLTLERAKELNRDQVTEPHLIIHSTNVMAAMGAMAEHFGEDKEHWMAVAVHDGKYNFRIRGWNDVIGNRKEVFGRKRVRGPHS